MPLLPSVKVPVLGHNPDGQSLLLHCPVPQMHNRRAPTATHCLILIVTNRQIKTNEHAAVSPYPKGTAPLASSPLPSPAPTREPLYHAQLFKGGALSSTGGGGGHTQHSTALINSITMGGRYRLRPAVLAVESVVDPDNDDVDLNDPSVPVLEIQLWRSDAVSSVVEVDSHLVVARADVGAGLIFGVPHKLLLKKSFKRWGRPWTRAAWKFLFVHHTQLQLGGP